MGKRSERDSTFQSEKAETKRKKKKKRTSEEATHASTNEANSNNNMAPDHIENISLAELSAAVQHRTASNIPTSKPKKKKQSHKKKNPEISSTPEASQVFPLPMTSTDVAVSSTPIVISTPPDAHLRKKSEVNGGSSSAHSKLAPASSAATSHKTLNAKTPTSAPTTPLHTGTNAQNQGSAKKKEKRKHAKERTDKIASSKPLATTSERIDNQKQTTVEQHAQSTTPPHSSPPCDESSQLHLHRSVFDFSSQPAGDSPLRPPPPTSTTANEPNSIAMELDEETRRKLHQRLKKRIAQLDIGQVIGRLQTSLDTLIRGLHFAAPASLPRITTASPPPSQTAAAISKKKRGRSTAASTETNDATTEHAAIVVSYKRTPIENIKRAYSCTPARDGSDLQLVDVTDTGGMPFSRLDPAYPHGCIPVPGGAANGLPQTGVSVTAVWEALKVFENEGVSPARLGQPLGPVRKERGTATGRLKGWLGPSGKLIGEAEARFEIYLPAYKFVLESCCTAELARMREVVASGKRLVLLGPSAHTDVADVSRPINHAALVMHYLQGTWPQRNC